MAAEVGEEVEDALDRRADAAHLGAPVAVARALQPGHREHDAHEPHHLDHAQDRHRPEQGVLRRLVEADGHARDDEGADHDEGVDQVEEVLQILEAEGEEAGQLQKDDDDEAYLIRPVRRCAAGRQRPARHH